RTDTAIAANDRTAPSIHRMPRSAWEGAVTSGGILAAPALWNGRSHGSGNPAISRNGAPAFAGATSKLTYMVISPAPRAHWYFAASTCTGISVEYAYDGMPCA